MIRRREWILAAALAIVALLVVVASAPEDRQIGDPRPSTFLSTDDGAKALYLMLEELDLPVERGLSRWSGNGPDASALALIAPTIPPSPEELDALTTWIEAGGILVYGARRGDPTLDALGLAPLLSAKAPRRTMGTAAGAPGAQIADTTSSPTDAATDFDESGGYAPATARAEAHRWTEGVDVVHGFHDVFSDSAEAFVAGNAVPLLRLSDGRITAVIVPRGSGTVIAFSDVAPLRNHALRTSGAALLLARIVAEATADGEPLVFDEVHHGFRGDGHAAAGTLRFLRERPAGHATLQLLAVALILLIAAGWRFGAPLPPTPAERRSPLEHVDALAELYRQADARETTRRLLLAQLARRLGKRMPLDADDDTIDPILAGLRADPATIEAIHAEWRRGRRTDLATLTNAMDRLVNEVRRT